MTFKTKNGGSAFPWQIAFKTGDEINGEKSDENGVLVEGGMTLRDYFAAKALQAIIDTNPEAQIGSDEEEARVLRAIAGASYAFADAMLKKREEKETT